MNNREKLYRTQGIIAGVLGGIAEYVDLDPTVVRLAYVILVLVTGIMPGVIVYIVAWLIMPKRPDVEVSSNNIHGPAEPQAEAKEEGLKKPEWPSIEHLKPVEEEKIEDEPEQPSLDDLLDKDDNLLDELMGE